MNCVWVTSPSGPGNGTSVPSSFLSFQGYSVENSSVPMLPGEIRELSRPSNLSFCWPREKHSSTELDIALNGRLLSEMGWTAVTHTPPDGHALSCVHATES